MKIYIVYAFADADKVLSSFERDGHDEFLILRRNGCNFFWKKIARHKIRQADYVLCMISHNFIYSQNIEWEIEYAKANGKMIFYHKVDSNVDVPGRFREFAQEIKKINNLADYMNDYFEMMISRCLFNEKNPDILIDRGNKVFEQYKIMVDSSNKLSELRYATNKLHLAMNGAIFSAVALLIKNVNSWDNVSDGILFVYAFLAVIGIGTNYVWAKQVVSYRQLSSGKFKIINMLEKYLKVAIFSAEWKALANGKDHKVYTAFTQNEERIPKIISYIYAFSIVIVFLLKLGGVLCND